MMPGRVSFVVSALITVAFVGVMAAGIAAGGDFDVAQQRAGLMTAVEAMARETFAID